LASGLPQRHGSPSQNLPMKDFFKPDIPAGVFRADADEQNGILFDEAGAKDTAERLTRQWLEKHSKLLTAQA